jgi:acid phosphatase type 7
LAHPDKVEKDLRFHFATGTHPIENGRWADLTHALEATVHGRPIFTNLGPAQALVFDGYTSWLEAARTKAEADKVLPKREFTVAAWVFLEDTRRNGGLAGFFQDNGSYERGWLLGYNDRSFFFALTAQEGAGAQGNRTVVRGRHAIEKGRWQHVAATYDGAAMRLYVNGQLGGESTAQIGDIAYPDKGRLALAAYADDDELRPMEGGLYEVKLYARVLPAAEIEAAVERNKALLEYKPPVNEILKFVVKPYLQAATATSIVVMAETSQPSTMTVEFAEVQPLAGRVATEKPAYISEIALTGLKPRSRYFYRVTSRDEAGNLARSEVATFQTDPGPDQAWAFGILGDTQRNPDVTRRCAEGMFALRPNFMVHCGDVVDDGFAKNQWVDDLFGPASLLFAHVPSFPVIGNHEKNSHWYYDYFSLPAPEYFYTFTYGNAQFFMIDSNKDCSPGSEQYKWLQQALAASKATWKFAAHHHPCFSSDEDDYGDHWRGKSDAAEYTWGDSNVQKLVPVYEKYGVDIVFSGHIHSYERTWPILNLTINQKKGVRYIVTGGGGGGLEQAAPQRAWFSIHVARGHHYCFATVFDRTMQFKAYDLEGRMFDTFELTKPEDR